MRRAFQDGGELTYTCTPPGSGVRIGIDRDEDGVLDGDEEDAGSDSAVATSTLKRIGSSSCRRGARRAPLFFLSYSPPG